jgi:hypothetical protein
MVRIERVLLVVAEILRFKRESFFALRAQASPTPLVAFQIKLPDNGLALN